MSTAEVNDKYHDYEGGKRIVYGNADASWYVQPGTKWCGKGNIAKNFSDLGSAFETDRCCRAHDHCSVFINAGDTKYEMKNHFFFTLCHCECDNAFYHCLRRSNDAQGKSVLERFFYVLRMPCFILQKRPVCVKKNFWDKWFISCSKYQLGNKAVLMRLPQVSQQPLPNLKFYPRK